MGRGRASRSLAALRAVFANAALRRVELAYVLFLIAKWGTRLAILVFAYQRGGTAEAGFVAVIGLIPSALTAPMASVFGDRFRRERALLAGYAVQTLAVGATAASLLAEAPTAVIYPLTAVVSGSMTLTRPLQSALFPQLARSPDELVAVNVVAETVNGGMALIGPVAAGVMLDLGGAGLAVAVFAGLLLGSTLLVVGLAPHPPAFAKARSPLRGVAAGIKAVARERDQRLVVGLQVGQSMVAGAMDVLVIALALSLLGLAPSAVGYLAAARGAGGVVGGAAGLRLVGNPGLAAALALGLLVFGFGVSTVAFAVVAALAAASLAVASSGHAWADTAGRTLLQRVVPDAILARVFGVYEGVHQAGLAIGSAMAPLLVVVVGVRGAILLAGLALLGAILLLRRPIRAVDRATRFPERELAILGSVDLFAPLSAESLEGIAALAREVAVTPGVPIMREGEAGDRFYVVEEGEVEVSRDGRPIATLGAGDYVGEIALLRDVPRTATVSAKTPAKLLALDRADFLEAVVGYPVIREAAEPTIEERLLENDPASSPPDVLDPPDRG